MSQSGSWKFTPEATAPVSQLINSMRWMTWGRAQGPGSPQPVTEREELGSGRGWQGSVVLAALAKGAGENGGLVAGLRGAPTVPALLSTDDKKALAFPIVATLGARGVWTCRQMS